MGKSRRRRSQTLAKRRTQPGAPPGSLVVDPAAESTIVRVIGYGNGGFHESVLSDLGKLDAIRRQHPTVWIDVTGLGSESTLRALASQLGLHPLAMEDVVNVHQRAKVDEFSDYLFVVARMIDGGDAYHSEQLSFFVRPGLLVSFQERSGDCWDPIRQRLKHHRGKVCEGRSDYLLYALLDAVIDSYFPVMEQIAELADGVEEAITLEQNGTHLMQVHELRGQLLALRRSIRPHREMLNELVRDSTSFIEAETRVHLRDCYDHTIQLIDSIDTYRELTSDLRDYYLSTVSNSMNEVMKVLTIISTIFIPLSFVAGVYGMNFKDHSPWNMPELGWYFGYPFALGLMATIACGLLVYFRMRRWF
ncbi:magnesium/cobalt transporter CorA [Pirellulaceae bacterium SH501]